MSEEFPPDYPERFGGMARLYGADGLERLRRAHVCVIGVGGVGSWTVEALARSGVGALTMIDLDDVCVTNVNRQLPALDGSIGQPKVLVLEQRVKRINPGCRVRPVLEFLTEDNHERLLDPALGFDYVIDAVDRTSTKALIIARATRHGIPALTVGGAGGRRDGSAARVADLAFSQGDQLLRGVRRLLRRDHGFPRNEKHPFGVACVYSAEPQVFPWADGTCRATAEPDGSLRMDCASGFGAATFVTGVFGFLAAGEAVRFLTEKKD